MVWPLIRPLIFILGSINIFSFKITGQTSGLKPVLTSHWKLLVDQCFCSDLEQSVCHATNVVILSRRLCFDNHSLPLFSLYNLLVWENKDLFTGIYVFILFRTEGGRGWGGGGGYGTRVPELQTAPPPLPKQEVDRVFRHKYTLRPLVRTVVHTSGQTTDWQMFIERASVPVPVTRLQDCSWFFRLQRLLLGRWSLLFQERRPAVCQLRSCLLGTALLRLVMLTQYFNGVSWLLVYSCTMVKFYVLLLIDAGSICCFLDRKYRCDFSNWCVLFLI